MIKEGTAEVTLTDASGTKHVRTLSAGNSCGELSLLTGEPRSATVKATSDTLVLLIIRQGGVGFGVFESIRSAAPARPRPRFPPNL